MLDSHPEGSCKAAGTLGWMEPAGTHSWVEAVRSFGHLDFSSCIGQVTEEPIGIVGWGRTYLISK